MLEVAHGQEAGQRHPLRFQTRRWLTWAAKAPHKNTPTGQALLPSRSRGPNSSMLTAVVARSATSCSTDLHQ